MITPWREVHYMWWQLQVDIENELSEYIAEDNPDKWRIVDNREKYKLKREKLGYKVRVK